MSFCIKGRSPSFCTASKTGVPEVLSSLSRRVMDGRKIVSPPLKRCVVANSWLAAGNNALAALAE